MISPRPPKTSGLLAAAALFAACLVVYWPAFGGGFIWDDWKLIVENPALRGLDHARLWWMATSYERSTFQPLGWLAYAFIEAAWGLNPFFFHAAGVALHAVCASLLFLTARRLLELAGRQRAAETAFAAALLWAVHPLQAATAAWATEIPDQLATAFFLGALILYLAERTRARLAAALGFFALSGLCRWKGVSLPLVLIALDFYPLRRLRPSRGDPLDWANKRVWNEKLAFALVAAAIVFANSLAKASSRFVLSFEPGAIARGLLLYPRLIAWPEGLLPFYDTARGLGSRAAVALVVLCAAAAAAFRRRLPAAPAIAAGFGAGLLPPLMNSKFGLTLAYPHYAYLATMGLFVGAAALLDGPARRRGTAAVVLALSLYWGGLARRLVPLYGDEIRFWARATVLDEENVIAHGNLGAALARAGRFDEASFHLEAAERLSRGPYLWNQPAQHRNLLLLKSSAAGLILKPGPARERLEFGEKLP